ncbi:hypothetical protein DBR32_03650 [Taibaiella sp. KBW10]|uniref:hypothetical protein n=1 Tax=Taibaiella sp. KBW10 TaxID=2153357 RepID=UPI000F5B7A80|nr:hypothetical protein [Taibaiella sp. KBW10]RQO31911.1 hypothetical protein DBR32_03650 [Taibaiella sp. KBW10]
MEQLIGASKGVLSRALAKDTDIQSKWIIKIVENYPHYNAEWLLTGKGEMLKELIPKKANLIHLYKDLGHMEAGDQVAESNQALYQTEYIDAGDWFPGATAATRYYNTSMKEYPSGCLLILRQQKDLEALIWGEHYIIEYGDNSVMKEIQPDEDEQHLLAYSTNDVTYPDGRLKYPPIKIPKTQVRRAFQVLGHIYKRHNRDLIYT